MIIVIILVFDNLKHNYATRRNDNRNSRIILPFINQSNHELQKALKTLNITPVYKAINKFICLMKLRKDKCKLVKNAKR